jgi:lysophospholipase L1-like esterase
MQPGELVLLTVPQDSMKCAGMGIINPNTFMPYPIPDHFVLKLDEVTALQNATAAYNAIIEQLAEQSGLAVVDINTHSQTLEAGIVWDGIKLSTKFITGGAFSTDGIHLNPRGNAVTTNYIIDAINAKYGSNIPKADITAYPGLIFP